MKVSVAKKKGVMLKMKFESNINGVIEKIADLGMSLPPYERRHMCSHR